MFCALFFAELLGCWNRWDLGSCDESWSKENSICWMSSKKLKVKLVIIQNFNLRVTLLGTITYPLPIKGTFESIIFLLQRHGGICDLDRSLESSFFMRDLQN